MKNNVLPNKRFFFKGGIPACRREWDVLFLGLSQQGSPHANPVILFFFCGQVNRYDKVGRMTWIQQNHGLYRLFLLNLKKYQKPEHFQLNMIWESVEYISKWFSVFFHKAQRSFVNILYFSFSIWKKMIWNLTEVKGIFATHFRLSVQIMDPKRHLKPWLECAWHF